MQTAIFARSVSFCYASPHTLSCPLKTVPESSCLSIRKAGSISMRCWYSSHNLPGNDWISRMIKLLMSTDTARAFYEGLMVQIASLIRKAVHITEDEIKKKKVMGISRDRNRHMVGFLDVSRVLTSRKSLRCHHKSNSLCKITYCC